MDAAGAVLASAGLAGLVLWRRHRATRNARQVTARVLETCDLLAGELAAGTPRRARSRGRGRLARARPVVEAQELGSSVPEALRRLAALPGAGDLRLVAAAWQVAHRSGTGLALR
ncbi:MAG: hypothetical protein R2731_09330 [Nocardioides sp.]